MIVLDAYVLIALVAKERAAPMVRDILYGDDHTAICAINLGEVIDVLLRTKGVGLGEAQRVVGPLLADSIEVVEMGEEVAWRAAALRARYYRRRQSEISLADCCLLAIVSDGDSIATSDPAVIEVAQSEGMPVIQLPESG